MNFYSLLFCLLTCTMHAMDKQNKEILKEKLNATTIKTIQLIIERQEKTIALEKQVEEDFLRESPQLDFSQSSELFKSIKEQSENFLSILPLIKNALKDSPTKEIIGDNTFKSISSTTSIEDK